MFAMTPIPGPRYVGVGFSKTGTSTLGACFGLLGLGPVGSPDAIHDIFRQSVPSAPDNPRAARFAEYPWRLMVDDLCQYDSYGVALFIAAGFRSLHDRPWSMKDCFKVLDSAYPGSRFILTWREPERWWRSVEHWLTVTHRHDREKLPRYLAHLGVDRFDKDTFIGAYIAHNQRLASYFKDRPEDFLAINFEAGEGWEKLCPFLGKPIPDLPLPHANRQAYSVPANMAETAG